MLSWAERARDPAKAKRTVLIFSRFNRMIIPSSLRIVLPLKAIYQTIGHLRPSSPLSADERSDLIGNSVNVLERSFSEQTDRHNGSESVSGADCIRHFDAGRRGFNRFIMRKN